MLRTVAALTATAALLAATVAAATAANAGEAPAPAQAIRPQPIRWSPCADNAAVQCGNLPLPIDRSRPVQTFGLAIARRPATDPRRRIGALFLNPGGPGVSGVDLVKQADHVFTGEIRARFDLIGFDPRGIAGSSPVQCTEAMTEKHLELVHHTPQSAAEFSALTAHNKAYWQDCGRRSGSLIGHYDTLNVVQDMDALRAALGEDKISYLGVSYGTLIGQQYAARYGKHLRAMVIDSTMDHRLGGHPLAVTAAAGVEAMFGQFVAWCGKTDSCALHGQDIPRRWDALLAAGDQGTLYDGAGELASADQAIGTAGAGLSSLTWPYLAEWINAATIGKPPAQKAAPRTAARTAPQVPLVSNPEGVFCEDWDAGLGTFADYLRLDRDSRAAAPHMRYDTNMREALLGCAGSPRPLPLNNPPSAWHPDPAGPVILIANSRYDSKTSHAWAESLLKQGGKKAVLLTYEGWGHNTYTHSPCSRAASDAYLLGEKTPAPGASCPAPSTGPIVPQPNTQSFDAPGQSSRPDQGDW